MQEIACATRYLSVDDTVYMAEVVVNTHIHNAQMETMLSAEHIDSSSTSCEVNHLLPGDFPW